MKKIKLSVDEESEIKIDELMKVLEYFKNRNDSEDSVETVYISGGMWNDDLSIWYFPQSEHDNLCHIWNGSEFKRGVECKVCGTYNLRGETCDDCKDVEDGEINE